jgi:hypothetical protein
MSGVEEFLRFSASSGNHDLKRASDAGDDLLASSIKLEKT